MTWVSNLAKFALGVVLAIAILIGGSAVLALYFMHKVTTNPPKPVFANDQEMLKAQPPASLKTPKPSPSPITQKTAEPTPSETPSPKPLEAGAYRARVTWQQGLIMRTEPDLDAERISGLDYNQQIVVLEESADKTWQRVRLENGEQQGWVKAGNTQPVEADQ